LDYSNKKQKSIHNSKDLKKEGSICGRFNVSPAGRFMNNTIASDFVHATGGGEFL